MFFSILLKYTSYSSFPGHEIYILGAFWLTIGHATHCSGIVTRSRRVQSACCMHAYAGQEASWPGSFSVFPSSLVQLTWFSDGLRSLCHSRLSPLSDFFRGEAAVTHAGYNGPCSSRPRTLSLLRIGLRPGAHHRWVPGWGAVPLWCGRECSLDKQRHNILSHLYRFYPRVIKACLCRRQSKPPV